MTATDKVSAYASAVRCPVLTECVVLPGGTTGVGVEAGAGVGAGQEEASLDVDDKVQGATAANPLCVQTPFVPAQPLPISTHQILLAEVGCCSVDPVSAFTVEYQSADTSLDSDVEIQTGVHRLRTSAASRQPKVRVFITRITAAHLPKMDMFGKCDAFCELLVGGERVKTEVKKNTYSPTWEEDITMETKGGDLVLRMSDWDRNSASDLIGSLHITHEELLSAMGREKRLARGL
eukprot:2661359-Rhodomonas_salina.1